MNTFALAMVSLTTAWIFLGSVAIVIATRRARRTSVAFERRSLPAVTVLKPLCGADPSLRENLESFFVQDHPHFEIVFGVERASDPGVAIAEGLMRTYPRVKATIVVRGESEWERSPESSGDTFEATGSHGHNPKVRNLRSMIRHAEHDLVLVSDSNVRAPLRYVSGMVNEIARDPTVGLVTSVFAGTGGGSLGGDLECVELSGFCAAGASLATLAGDAAVVGKSMLFSRSELASLGGLARVADVLAEDFVLGKMFQNAGRRVVIADAVIENIVGKMTLRGFFERRLRWSMLRFRLRPVAFILEPATSPLAMLPFAWHVMGSWSIAWLATLLFLRDVLGWILLSGFRQVHKPLLLSPLREVSALAVWAIAPLKRHVSWRGHRLRVHRGTVLASD